MSVDYKWMSNGGLLLDGSGDIALTDSPLECAISMVRTRLKSAVDGWKLYKIGAGLDDFRGGTSDAITETAVKRQILATLSNNYLPSNVFDVRTLRVYGHIQAFVYLNQQLIAQITVNTNSNSTVV